MNIFALDESPYWSAVYQHDKHVVKMTLESAQMASAVLRYHRPEWLHHLSDVAQSKLYRATHVHHPCTKWAAKNLNNFSWLLAHGMFLGLEYTHRFGRVHKSQRVIEHCLPVAKGYDYNSHTPFAVAMPPEYRIKDDPVLSYRLYYVSTKIHDDSKWSHRRSELPSWLFERALHPHEKVVQSQ